ncbi:hypothetical protein ACWGN5_00305 [Streptomyces sp. NPDC055815]
MQHWELGQGDHFRAGRDTQIGWLAQRIELLRRLDAVPPERHRAGQTAKRTTSPEARAGRQQLTLVQPQSGA